MNDIIVYTCITNDRDDLQEYIPEPGVRYICFTDGTIDPQTDQWEIKPLAIEYDNPTKTARYHKINPHIILPDHEWSVWVDGHIKPSTRQTEIIEWMKDSVFGVMDHIERSCIYEEMVILLDSDIESEHMIKRLFTRYKDEGFPPMFGLHRTGVLIRKNIEANTKFNDLWWNELDSNSCRDQLSFDYVRWIMNFCITTISNLWYKQTTHKDYNDEY